MNHHSPSSPGRLPDGEPTVELGRQPASYEQRDRLARTAAAGETLAADLTAAMREHHGEVPQTIIRLCLVKYRERTS